MRKKMGKKGGEGADRRERLYRSESKSGGEEIGLLNIRGGGGHIESKET